MPTAESLREHGAVVSEHAAGRHNEAKEQIIFSPEDGHIYSIVEYHDDDEDGHFDAGDISMTDLGRAEVRCGACEWIGMQEDVGDGKCPHCEKAGGLSTL